MTRIESGALAVRPTLIPLDELVDESLAAVNGLVPRSRVQIDARTRSALAGNRPCPDRAGPGQPPGELRRACARPAASIRIGARSVGRPYGTVRRDFRGRRGPGHRTPRKENGSSRCSARTSGGGRAGLGLAIAKAFVEAHGGTIWVDPGSTRGARVVFTVPAAANVAAACVNGTPGTHDEGARRRRRPGVAQGAPHRAHGSWRRGGDRAHPAPMPSRRSRCSIPTW